MGPLDEVKDWPLEVVTHQGKTLRYAHPAGTMVLYEVTDSVSKFKENFSSNFDQI